MYNNTGIGISLKRTPANRTRHTAQVTTLNLLIASVCFRSYNNLLRRENCGQRCDKLQSSFCRAYSNSGMEKFILVHPVFVKHPWLHVNVTYETNSQRWHKIDVTARWCVKKKEYACRAGLSGRNRENGGRGRGGEWWPHSIVSAYYRHNPGHCIRVVAWACSSDSQQYY